MTDHALKAREGLASIYAVDRGFDARAYAEDGHLDLQDVLIVAACAIAEALLAIEERLP